MDKRILVIGGGGKNGRRVVNKLKNLGLQVLFTTRIKEDVKEGVVFFDWNDPSTYHPVLQDVEKVYIVHPDTSMPGAYEQIEELVNNMVKQSVSKAVLLSGRGQESVEKCEEILKDSSLEWVIIRSAWFSQNFNEGHFLQGIKTGEVVFLSGAVTEPFVDLDDLSDVVVETILHKIHNGKVYEVTGEELLTFKDAVEMIGQYLGYPVKYILLNKDEYLDMLKQAGLPDDMAKHFVWTFSEILDGRNQNIGDGIHKVLGRKPKTFSEFIKTNKFDN
ncbi:MAG: NAD(P)H-binding protein [Chryseobacterium jejuense]|uniref:NAD(P)H-binding protein n=1 Tax=Chryseobacterium jejuense TaxID=445960 RepID=UPI003D106C82